MKRLLAYLLTVLLLLQSFGRELLVLHFKANQTELAAKYCVNKTRPSLHCDGKCYLARQLRRAERGPAKVPAEAWAKVKFEVLAPMRLRLLPPVWQSCHVARRYAQPVPRTYVAVTLQGVFHPPVFQG